MSTLKKILLALIIIIAIPFVVALFVKKDYVISREIIINKPKSEVFNYIRYLKNQDHYSKWVMTDPNMKKQFSGTDGNVGFVYAWDGNDEAGKGEQEIKGITEGEKLDIEVRFQKPMQSVAKTPFITESVSANQTKVTWGMEGRNTYPLNFMNLFIGKMLAKDIDTSLLTLKNIMEKS